ncbi:hypothetical protein CLV63_13433 [Murinocardiopsis flavida]|uniref:Uncharacterized protein n=1 Tax=Murinocardiopsis flavida TaxID=645275 RepID=A0A2P8CNJ5_9ACTN|nr:hypothetical protein [Murinocardiopsis flavida]PSK86546.1 hypothetical protein CLV63_13433 [Murinocardiopsis flavida]
MRKSDSAGRAGARRSRRSRSGDPEQRSRPGRRAGGEPRRGRGQRAAEPYPGERAEDSYDDTYGDDRYPDDRYDGSRHDTTHPDYDPDYDAPGDHGGPADDWDDPDGADPRETRSEARGGSRRARKAVQSDPLSRFSASALKRVSVLGDRPNQIVYSLAGQSRGRSGTVVLAGLLGLTGLAMVVLLAVLVYLLLSGSTAGSSANNAAPIIDPPDGHSTLQPELYHEQPDQEIFAPIAERPKDAKPMTEKQVFGDTGSLELDSTKLSLGESQVTEKCTSAVWGKELAESLADGGCNSAAQGVYHDSDKEFVAQFVLFDVADSDASAAVAEQLTPKGTPGFLLPLDSDLKGLHEGYSQATTQVMGHYVAVFWVARADGGEPKNDDSMATLNVVTMDAAVSVYEQVHAAEGD